MQSITEVIAKAPSRDLTTLATAKDELQITGSSYDKRLARWIREKSAAVERFCGRRLVNETLQQTFTANHVGYHPALVLSLYPVSEVVSVAWNSEVLTPDQWMLDGEAGLLRRFSVVDNCWVPWFGPPDVYWYFGYPYPEIIVVEYTGGYTLGVDLPPDIEAAVLIQLQQHKAARSRDQTIRSESVPNVLTTTYMTATPNGLNMAIAPAAQALLEPYREQRI